MKYKILSTLDKRDVLYSEKTPQEDLIGYGDVYFEDGLTADALEFYGAARHRDGLLKVRKVSLETADSYLLRRLLRVDEELVKPEHWQELGQKALEMEKFRDALEAFSRSGDEKKKAEVEEKLGIRKKEEDGAASKETAEKG